MVASMPITTLILSWFLQMRIAGGGIVVDDGSSNMFDSPSLTVQRSDSIINYSSSRQRRQTCLVCNVAAADVQYGFNETGDLNDFLVCMTNSDQEPDGAANRVYRLDQLPKAFVKQYQQQLYSGRYRICISRGRASRDVGQQQQIEITNSTNVQLLPPDDTRRRHLALSPSKSGNHTVLVVRVTSSIGEDPGLTAEELQGYIFGIGPNAQVATLRSQYAACSLGKLTMSPAVGINVVNGVIDVEHKGQVAGGDIVGALQSALLQETSNLLGIGDLESAADHIMFCLPPGSMVSPGNSKWIAFSYLGKWLSFFQNGWCSRLTGQVHEIGHQLGFRHSGMGTHQYGDFSCVMGASYGVTARPQMCFNGHKNWFSTWFDDHKVVVDPIASGAWVGNLVTFVDVPMISQVPRSVAVINVDSLYIELNSAKKYNFQVVANGNKVTVVENNSTSQWSNILVGLSSGESYIYRNFSGTGIGLAIEICSIHFGTVDYSKISLYLLDGVQESKCSTPLLFPPTSSPSRTTDSPSLSPTLLPTPSPTNSPSSSPTNSPSLSPTNSPTSSPTLSPSFSPTLSPTSSPTLVPSSPPTTDAPSFYPLPPGVRALNLTAPEVIEYPEGVCFSEANTVEIKQKGVVSIKELRIGDLVKTVDGAWDRVYSFGHYQNNTNVDYLQIYLKGLRKPLEISKDHLLFVKGAAVPASNVAVGDHVQVDSRETRTVKQIGTVTRAGAYAPFTMSGTIVVSGVVASSYVTLQEGSSVLVIGGYRTPLSMHWLAHVFQSPHRLVCLLSTSNCKTESYTTDGISKWVDGPLRVSQWMLQQNVLLVIVLFVPSLVLWFVVYSFEVLFFGSKEILIGVWCLAIAVALCSFLPGKNRKMSK